MTDLKRYLSIASTLLAIALALSVLLSGCASMSQEDQQKHTTVLVTMKVIEETDLTANEVRDMVLNVRDGASQNQPAFDLKAEILKELDFDDLAPSDQYLVNLLIEPILAFEDTELDPENPVVLDEQLEQWLEWVEQAAYLSGAE